MLSPNEGLHAGGESMRGWGSFSSVAHAATMSGVALGRKGWMAAGWTS